MPIADREGIDWARNGPVIKKTELVATFKREENGGKTNVIWEYNLKR